MAKKATIAKVEGIEHVSSMDAGGAAVPEDEARLKLHGKTLLIVLVGVSAISDRTNKMN